MKYDLHRELLNTLLYIHSIAKSGDFCAFGTLVKLPRSKPQVPADVTGSNSAWDSNAGGKFGDSPHPLSSESGLMLLRASRREIHAGRRHQKK